MNNSIAKLTILSFAVLTSITSVAKTPDYRGVVTDEKGNPLPFANVVLLSLPDSAFVQGAMTDEKGAFSVVTDKKGGVLKVTSIGYETQIIPAADALTIQMKEDAQLLGEVVVKGMRPKTKVTGEGLQTSIQGSVLEHAGTANDVLAKTPGIIKGQNGLEVIGKGSPQVYINGRRVTDVSELERLQSNEIQNIEVITNPGAQYDATVRSVVRIRTIRRQGDGFSFNLNASDSQSPRWKEHNDPFGAVNVNYRTGGVDFFGGVNFIRNSFRQESNVEKTSFGKTFVIENKGTLMNDNYSSSIYGNAGVNWQLATNHFVGGKVEWGRTLSNYLTMIVDDNVYENSQLIDKLTTSSEDHLGDHTPYRLGANLYYNGLVGSKLGIDVNLDYYGNDDSRTSLSEETSTMTHNASVSSGSYNAGRLYAAKAVLSYPIWKGQLQGGTEETFSHRTDEYTVTGVSIPSSSAEVEENNYAGFASYAFVLGRAQLSAGVRYEYVHYAYTDALAPESNLTRNYDNWFPTLSYAGMAGPVQLMLNYSAKTRRPNYANLSNAIRYNSRYIWQSGNAQLQPEFSHNFGVTAVWKFYTLMVNYARTDDAIMTWSSPYGDEGIVLVKPRNIETPYRAMTAMLNVTPTFGPWTINYSVGIQPQWLTIYAEDPREPSGIRTTTFNNHPVYFAQLFNTLKVTGGWQFELGGVIQSKGWSQNLYMRNVFCNVSAAVQKTMLRDGSLVARLEGADLLGTAQMNVFSDFGSHTISQTNLMDIQRIKFSLRYSFNAAQSKYRGTGAGKEAQERM
ncbi:MAG: outer membrane beta-barrel protein [Bacteroidaceae bacterium]|nr:outer membrane beta-barrel protein [Bacteroidaceae bacterium]